ncbi:MAG: SURF1 family protein [Nitriliruptoraceae bacterium]|nr:SURF1 family protein [Nitriliruptoraceae bacterium]
MLPRLLRPKALLSHVLVVAVAGVCVWLGTWQLDRLDERRAENALAEDRMTDAPVPLQDLVDPDDPGGVDLDTVEFRRVTVTGTFRADEEVLRRGQQHQGQSGFHVLTPLDLGDDRTLLVLRGFAPAQLVDEPGEARIAPADGEVTLTGVLEAPVGQPTTGPQDPVEGELTRVFHTDTARLDGQMSGTLLPLVFRVDPDPDAPFDQLPVAVARDLDERNHLSYAVQWFSFAVLAAITYVAWGVTRLRRDPADERGRRPDDPDPDDPDGRGGGGLDHDPQPDRPLVDAGR